MDPKPILFGIALLIAVTAGPAEARIWNDASGKNQIDAEFVKLDSGGVHLKRATDGKVIVVRLALLSAADQQHVKGLVAANQPAKPSRSVDELIALLKEEDDAIRLAAIADLEKHGTSAAKAVPKLEKHLETLAGNKTGVGPTPNAFAGIAIANEDKEAMQIANAIEKIEPDKVADFYEFALKLDLPIKTRDEIVARVLKLPRDEALDICKKAISKPASLSMWSALSGALRTFGPEGAKIADRAKRNL